MIDLVLGTIAAGATLVLFVVLRQNARLEKRVEELERLAHPPVDLRPLLEATARKIGREHADQFRAIVRDEVERVLEEHVP